MLGALPSESVAEVVAGRRVWRCFVVNWMTDWGEAEEAVVFREERVAPESIITRLVFGG